MLSCMHYPTFCALLCHQGSLCTRSFCVSCPKALCTCCACLMPSHTTFGPHYHLKYVVSHGQASARGCVLGIVTGKHKGKTGVAQNVCFSCGKLGHWAKNCPKLGGQGAMGTNPPFAALARAYHGGWLAHSTEECAQGRKYLFLPVVPPCQCMHAQPMCGLNRTIPQPTSYISIHTKPAPPPPPPPPPPT